MSNPNLIWIGAAGGLIPDVLRLINGRMGPPPVYLKSANFWLSLALLAGVGALSAYVGEAADVKQALAFGFGGPEFLSRLLGNVTRTPSPTPQPLPAQLGIGQAVAESTQPWRLLEHWQA